jgi:hypothetical protein
MALRFARLSELESTPQPGSDTFLGKLFGLVVIPGRRKRTRRPGSLSKPRIQTTTLHGFSGGLCPFPTDCSFIQ